MDREADYVFNQSGLQYFDRADPDRKCDMAHHNDPYCLLKAVIKGRRVCSQGHGHQEQLCDGHFMEILSGSPDMAKWTVDLILSMKSNISEQTLKELRDAK